MRQNLRVIPLAILTATCALDAQNVVSGMTDPLDYTRSGLHLYSVTVSSAYYTGSFATSGLSTPIVAGPNSEAVVLGASARLGWSKAGRKGGFSIVYAPSYVRSVYSLLYRSFNQGLAMSANRTLGPKWAIQASAQALISDFNQLLFAQTPYGSLAATPATFDQFSSAILTGRTDSTALTQLIGAAPLITSPENSFVYGGRQLTASGQVSISYAASTRSFYSFSVMANHTQYISAGSDAPTTGLASYVLPRTTSGMGRLSWSYSLTPRTSATFEVSGNRTVSDLQDWYLTQGTVSIGRTLSRRWFVQGMVGFGYISPVRQTSSSIQSAQQQYGGSIGYKLYAHTLLASYNRMASNIYGLGATATENSSGAWTWNRPGSTVALASTFGYSRLIGSAIPNWTSWMVQANASKFIGNHIAITLGYTYAQYPQTAVLGTPNLAQTGAILALTWSPSGRMERREPAQPAQSEQEHN